MSADWLAPILRRLGEQPERDGLHRTRERWEAAIGEMTEGYQMDPAHILGTSFEHDGYDEMIVLRSVRFSSLCEHHLFPFEGQVTVGYIPQKGRVVGLSKLARLVECFSRRLQIQERMTNEIATALMAEPVGALGAGVIVRANHSCMTCRGIRRPGSEMVTSAMLGVMREAAARAELLELAK